MWNTNTENLGLRREPQLRINSQREISELQSETKQNVDSVMTVQDAIEQNVDSVMTVQDAIEQNERNEKIDSQREISELQSETQQNVDSVMTVQDAIEQHERNEEIDILSRIRWTIESLYDNITKGKSMANSIDYMFFMADYNEIKQNDNDLRKLESEIWKDFFLDFRKAYLREKIFNNLRSDFPEEKKYLFIKDYIDEFKDIKADLSYIFEKCKTEEEKKLFEYINEEKSLEEIMKDIQDEIPLNHILSILMSLKIKGLITETGTARYIRIV